MSLSDIWLPEVEAEYMALLEQGRSVGVDVGNQFRAFEHVLAEGVDRAWRSIERCGTADLYVMYATETLMFFAVSEGRAAVVKWSRVGNDYQQTQALTQAKQRAATLFP